MTVESLCARELTGHPGVSVTPWPPHRSLHLSGWVSPWHTCSLSAGFWLRGEGQIPTISKTMLHFKNEYD